jgi:hypothetical protein
MSAKDPIVESVRSVREKLFEAHGESVDRLLDHYQAQEKLDQDRLIKNKSEKQKNESTPGAV